MKMIITAAAAALVLPSAAAAAPAPGDYLVEVSLREAGAPALTPSLPVRGGEAATFMKGDQHQWVKVTATPHSLGKVSVFFDRVVATAGGLHHDGSTRTLAADGKPVVVSAAGSPLEVEVRVRPLGR